MESGFTGNEAVYTIGHSTRTMDEFLEILKKFGIAAVADVRTVPGSRHNPAFSRAVLETRLREEGLSYIHFPGLGGLRKPLPRGSSGNDGWRNDSFRGFADYMQTNAFIDALNSFIAIALSETMVLMCAEALPWRCHRFLISDALFIRGIRVMHIISRTAVRPHELAGFAHVNGLSITYPAHGQREI